MANCNSLGTTVCVWPSRAYTAPLQPSFLAVLASNVTNATGAGAVYQLGSTVSLTEIFDQSNSFNVNGTFTAPITGKYMLCGSSLITNCVLTSVLTVSIITSNRTYTVKTGRTSVSQDIGMPFSVVADMEENDTAKISLTVTGELGNTATISGSNNSTFFCGYLVC